MTGQSTILGRGQSLFLFKNGLNVLVLLLLSAILFTSGTAALQPPSRNSNRAVLVTGSTDGIGMTSAKNLAAQGYHVLLHGRKGSRIDAAKTAVQEFAPNAHITALPPADISTAVGCMGLVTDVYKACQDKDLQLCVLLNNAGVYAEDHVITKEGLELTFAVNVLAPFVLTSHLLPLLLKQDSTRIVIASSISQSQSVRSWDDMHYLYRPYSAHAAYSKSKLLDAMLTMELADRLVKAGIAPTQLSCNCLDPGTVNTKMLLAGWGKCGMDVEDALDETWLCSSDDMEGITGKYFVNQQERASSKNYPQAERDKLWTLLKELAPEASTMWDLLPLQMMTMMTSSSGMPKVPK